MSEFFQDGPRLANQYSDDTLLQNWLRWRLPPDVLNDIEPGLQRLGERAVTDLAVMAQSAQSQPPQLIRYDAWGRRIDEIVVADGWRALHRAAAEEGIVATAYERRHDEYSRAHQLARLYLYHPSSAIYSCPLAMTDGAARVLELLGTERLRRRALSRLTSRDPDTFWTSGQWMTERTGGSDVSQTATVASRHGDGYRLSGTKWFSSATTADMALTLARLEDRPGLSLFYLETRRADGSLNGIRIDRLKDKLGTRALPTAELTLDGTDALLLGEPGAGVRNIATMLNVTRIYNAVCAVGYMRRGIALALDYAQRRQAFGRPLIEQPLHLQTLADLVLQLEGGFHLTFHVAWLLGHEECGVATDTQRALLRLLVPLTKLYTARQAVAVASEVLECFGGAGYVEDTGLPALLRDSQVLPIWEGTTNVLSLDAQRVLGKGGALEALSHEALARIDRAPPELAGAAARLGAAVPALHEVAASDHEHDATQAGARAFALAAAEVFAGALLIEHAAWAQTQGGADRAIAVAQRWCERIVAPAKFAAGRIAENRLLTGSE